MRLVQKAVFAVKHAAGLASPFDVMACAPLMRLTLLKNSCVEVKKQSSQPLASR